MKKLKTLLALSTIAALFACTDAQKTQTRKERYLKDNVSQTELNNATQYKRYYYRCRNVETGENTYLISYFPLSRESRMKDNFGFYFQLEGSKAQPFDHIQNRELNAKGTRFEVIYRSYYPILGSYVELVARKHSSVYYKNKQGARTPWLDCRER